MPRAWSSIASSCQSRILTRLLPSSTINFEHDSTFASCKNDLSGKWKFTTDENDGPRGSKLADGWGSAASGKIESRRMSGRSVALNTVSLRGSRRRILMAGPWLVHTQRKSLSKKARPLNARDLNSPFVDNGVISWRGQVESRFESFSLWTERQRDRETKRERERERERENVARPLFDNHCDRGFSVTFRFLVFQPVSQASTAWFCLRLLFSAERDTPRRGLRFVEFAFYSTIFVVSRSKVVLKITRAVLKIATTVAVRETWSRSLKLFAETFWDEL